MAEQISRLFEKSVGGSEDDDDLCAVLQRNVLAYDGNGKLCVCRRGDGQPRFWWAP